MTPIRRLAANSLALLALALASGCAATGPDRRDPYEEVNRRVFEFNEHFDRVVMKPAAEVYTAVTPDPIEIIIRNVFSNLNDVIVVVNDLLQFKFRQALLDATRIGVNTTFGFLGFADVATSMGLPKNDEDFGQTLAVWGFEPGPYIVLPLLGPSSVRDTVGWVGDIYTAPILDIDHVRTRNQVFALRLTQIRADLLGAEKVLDEAAIDRYNFMREAYFQRRLNQIHDGNPPRPRFEDFEEESEPAKPKPGASAPAEALLPVAAATPATATQESAPAADAPAMQPATPTPTVPDAGAVTVVNGRDALGSEAMAEPVATATAKAPAYVKVWLPQRSGR